MNLKQLIIENGEIDFSQEFISLRILKESLLKQFRFKVLEESNRYVSFKVLRMLRLFGGPMPFPNPTFNIDIIEDKGNFKITYEFISYDYYLLAFAAACFFASSSDIFGTPNFIDAVKRGLQLSVPILIIGGIAIKLDSMYFAHLLVKNLKKNIIKR